jgi:beta-aspartyl-peptidase (threonine type)
MRNLALVLALLPSPARAASPAADARAVLDAQVAAWNRHDLEGYMAGYWKSPDLTFYSGGTITRGWQPTLERYRKRYQSDGHEMGTLDFTEISVEPLGADLALARGRWRVTLGDGKKLQGLFTLVMRKLPEGWRIVHDHTSME